MNDYSRFHRPLIQRSLLALEQMQAVMTASQGSNLETLLLLAFETGLRLNELRGLIWADVDLEHATLHVERTLTAFGLTGYVLSAPKTEQDPRQLTLSPATVKALRQHHERQDQARKHAGDAWVERHFLFTDHLGRPLPIVSLLEQFYSIVQAAGLLGLRFHDLRRSVMWAIKGKGA